MPADAAGLADSPDPAAQFDAQIAPLLARRCLDCHNPSDKKGGLDLSQHAGLLAGGDSGAAIEPGDLAGSLLWQRVAADEMPPKQALATEERKLLGDWIAAGAVWGAPKIDRFRFSSETRAGLDWWSLQPVVRPEVPSLATSDAALVAWPKNELDHFLGAELQRHDLGPSPEADRPTLIRRLSFDLIGLPPTPEEIDAFLADDAPGAYERLVDRLLDSPQFGVRWARHWLDVVRFGESNGFEYDEFRPSAWPYRDWVVRALNSDLPYDEFARRQVAGDALDPDSRESVVATGFLAAGAYDTAGQGQQSAAMRAVVRQDEIEDRVGVLGQTFLGLTVNCARCHDHKFDPISQHDYYALVAALDGVRQGERDLRGLSIAADQAQRLAEMTGQRDALRQAIAAIEEPIRQRLMQVGPTQPPDVQPIAQWDFAALGAGASPDSLAPPAPPLALQGGARLEAAGLVLDGQAAYASSPLPRDLGAKSLEVVVRLDNLDQRAGGVLALQTRGGEIFDAIVFAERDPRKWLAGSNVFARTQPLAGALESTIDGSIHLCVTYADDQTIAFYRDGRPYGAPYRANDLAPFAAAESEIVFGLRHSPPAPGKHLAGVIERARVFDRALTADEVAALSGRYVSDAALRAHLPPSDVAEVDRLRADLAVIEREISALNPERAYAITPREPEPTRLLERGDPAKPAEVVPPGGVAGLPGRSANFDLAPGAPEAERRRRLAEWLTARDNPLFARVIVNRLWQHHFGAGLVDTPNDFGFNAGQPRHAALLDWLASELVEHDFRLKPLHRLIVSSAAYRQSAQGNAAAMAVDAENRLHWRKSPRRLEAEAARDAMLHVAGVLDLSLGGPGYQEMKMTIAPGTNTYLYAPDDFTRTDFRRRSLYRVWARSGRNPLLDALDCPDPSTTSPKRATTTTPIQALALLNGQFVLHAADLLAQRLTREAGGGAAAQVARVYRLAYGRGPTTAEAARMTAAIKQHGLAPVARAILNSNEFLYVD